MTRPAVAEGRNVVPGEYRGVAVSTVDCKLDQATLAQHFVGLEAYRRTRFIVVRNGDQTAIVAVRKESEDALFAPISEVDLLVGPDDCVYLQCPDVDTAVPTALARAARQHAPGKRGVVVEGSYSHVSFIIDPAPLQVTVRDVVPPYPAKLLDQTSRLLEVAEHLPPIELVAEVIQLDKLAESRPSTDYLLPCRGGRVLLDDAAVVYLDERPERAPWILIGCERSQQIHEWFYGDRAVQIDTCPRNRIGGTGALLTKCCLIEQHIEISDGRVIVPWGASLAQISEALAALVGEWEPTWAPA